MVLLPSIRGNGEVIKREEFEQRKAAAEAVREARLNRKPKKLASQGKDLTGCPLLQVRGERNRADSDRGTDRPAGCTAIVGVDVCKHVKLCTGPGTCARSLTARRTLPQPTTLSLHLLSTRTTHALPQALRDREEAVRNGKLCTIIFIRDRNARGQEVRWGCTPHIGKSVRTRTVGRTARHRKSLMTSGCSILYGMCTS